MHEGGRHARGIFDSTRELNSAQLQVRCVDNGPLLLINEAGADKAETDQSRELPRQARADAPHLRGHGLAIGPFVALGRNRTGLIDDHPLDGRSPNINARKYRTRRRHDGTHGTTT